MPNASDLIPPDRPQAEIDLVTEAIRTRLSGVLLAASDAGAIALSDHSIERLDREHRRALWWCLVLERWLLDVQHAFDGGGGIRMLVVKGPAIAHLDVADVSERTFADIDLLVHGDDLDRAVARIVEMGATRPWAERRRSYDRRFAKSVTLTMPDGVEIDVHRSLCDGAHGFRIDLDSIFATAGSFFLGGTEIACPDRTHRVVHCAYHLLLGSPSPSLMNLRDLARYLTDPAVVPADVIGVARSWRGEGVLAQAIGLVRSELGVSVPAWDPWTSSLTIADREQRVIDRQRVEGSALGRAKLDALRELRGPRRRAAYAQALVWPSRAHLRSRGMRRRDLWR